MEQIKRLPSPIRFGIFEVDPQAGELRRQGFKVKLQDQPFQVLMMLLERVQLRATSLTLRPGGLFKFDGYGGADSQNHVVSGEGSRVSLPLVELRFGGTSSIAFNKFPDLTSEISRCDQALFKYIK